MPRAEIKVGDLVRVENVASIVWYKGSRFRPEAGAQGLVGAMAGQLAYLGRKDFYACVVRSGLTKLPGRR